MKSYLLESKKRWQIAKGNIWLVKGGFTNLWPFVRDKHFFCVHLKYDSDLLFRSIERDSRNESSSKSSRSSMTHEEIMKQVSLNFLQGANAISADQLLDAGKVKQFIEESDLQIGIAVKRGNASINSVLMSTFGSKREK